MSRRLAREYAVQFLFSYDFNKDDNEEQSLDNMIEEFFVMKDSQMEEEKDEVLPKLDKSFSMELIKGTLSELMEIDERIKTSAISWKMERIAKVDLAILRLALYEILFRDDIPDSVTANESIEISKKFSTEDSSSFINGVIGKVIRSKA